MKSRFKFLFVSFAPVFFLSACSLGRTAFSASSPVADQPLFQQVTLTETALNDSGQNPNYSITGQVPTLAGVNDSRVGAFNTLAMSLVQAQVDKFKTDAASIPSVLADGSSSELNIQYTLLSPSLEIISIKFDISVFMQGAAHPYLLNRTLNFDLESGREINLDSLFLPNSDYLITIANFCAAELQKRDIGFDQTFAQGAAPLPENYLNWNITPDGLMITFEQYQVAAGAAGPQTVLVPYAELAALANPQGALAKFVQ